MQTIAQIIGPTVDDTVPDDLAVTMMNPMMLRRNDEMHLLRNAGECRPGTPMPKVVKTCSEKKARRHNQPDDHEEIRYWRNRTTGSNQGGKSNEDGAWCRTERRVLQEAVGQNMLRMCVMLARNSHRAAKHRFVKPSIHAPVNEPGCKVRDEVSDQKADTDERPGYAG